MSPRAFGLSTTAPTQFFRFYMENSHHIRESKLLSIFVIWNIERNIPCPQISVFILIMNLINTPTSSFCT